MKLKQDPGSWTATNVNRDDFQIDNDKAQNVADVFAKEPNAMTFKFPTAEETAFNALLISKAPNMAKGLIEIRSQLIDRTFKADSILITSIDNLLEGLTE